MTEKLIWGILIAQAVAAVLLSVVVGQIIQGRRSLSKQAGVMSLPLSIFVIGVIGCLFFADLTLFSAFAASKSGPWWPAAEFAVLLLLGAYTIAAYLLEKHELSKDGIASRNFLGTRKYMQWADIHSVRYSASMSWFRLKTTNSSVGISTWLIGLPEFAQIVLSHAPSGAIDDRTRQFLVDTAAGKRLQR